MGNCLKTQLKDAVDNSNLSTLGKAMFNVYRTDNPDYGANGTQRIRIKSSVIQDVECLDGGTFVDGTGSPIGDKIIISANNMTTLVCGNDDYRISTDKYTLTCLEFRGSSIGMNINDLSGCTSLSVFMNNNISETKGNLSSIKDLSNLTSFLCPSRKVEGNIADLPSSLIQLTLRYSDDIYGDVASLGKMKSLSVLELPDLPNVGGNLEDFCNAQVATPDARTSGTISCILVRNNIKYQGVIFSSNCTIRFGSSMQNPTSAETAQGWQIA